MVNRIHIVFLRSGGVTDCVFVVSRGLNAFRNRKVLATFAVLLSAEPRTPPAADIAAAGDRREIVHRAEHAEGVEPLQQA